MHLTLFFSYLKFKNMKSNLNKTLIADSIYCDFVCEDYCGSSSDSVPFIIRVKSRLYMYISWAVCYLWDYYHVFDNKSTIG